MDEPKMIKRAGRSIRNFGQSVWVKYAYNIVHEGNMHNFAQSLELFMALKGTAGSTLVDASPTDLIWGCECYENAPAAQQKETWRGLNVLGEILTEVLDELISERLELNDEGVLAVGLSLEPITDFGEL